LHTIVVPPIVVVYGVIVALHSVFFEVAARPSEVTNLELPTQVRLYV